MKCPKCSDSYIVELKTNKFKCKKCGYEFDDSSLKLTKEQKEFWDAGFDDIQKINSWISFLKEYEILGWDVKDAKEWKEAGFSPDNDIDIDWMVEQHTLEPAEAAKWKAQGFEAGTGGAWNFEQWYDEGFTPKKARKYIDSGRYVL